MSRVAGGQMFLLPQEPRELADHIGLDWWAARKLHDDQWLSFDPEKMLIESDAMRAEFLFLGSLVAAGCDPHLLKRLLTGLEKPYSYDLSTIYYDWRTKTWKDLPYGGFSAIQIAGGIIAELEAEGDVDSLTQIAGMTGAALDGAADDEEPEETPADMYLFDPDTDSIVSSTRLLLWKIATSKLVDTPEKIVTVGKLFGLLQRLPKVALDEYLRLDLVGPRRKYGDHEIYHFWSIEADEDGNLTISSGGHFYRPQTGGDTFTTMIWDASPGCRPELRDYLWNLAIVDDADTFENEVKAMDLDSGGYELSVEDASLEDWGADNLD